MKTKSFSPSRLAMALVAAGVIGGTAATAVMGTVSYAENAPTAAAIQSAPSPDDATVLPNFAQITREYGPAVVNISVSGTRKVSLAQEDPFAQFFFPGQMGQMPMQEVPMRGEGSGFIVSPDGIILTNAHVVQGANEVIVKLTDRREYRAKVLGSDPVTDIAVIKINATHLPVVKIGNVDKLNVGDWVLAIGSPYGLENTATAGIVSAKGRSLPNDTSVPFIQTDVPVNPGNSGGPLFNTRGEVVGINSQIYTRTGGYQGLSFAIPIDIATKIKDEIVAHGKARHAMLGVTVQEVNQELANSFKLDNPAGALVANVQKGSAADKAGLKAGDIIRAVDGHTIISSGDLGAIISLDNPGQRVKLDIWRDGKPEQLTATLGNYDQDDLLTSGNSQSGQHAKLGLALRPLTPAEQQQAGSPGLLVEQAQGAAAKAGIQPGDIILSVNGIPTQTVEQARNAVAKAGKTAALLIERGGDKLFVPVQIG